MLRTHVRQERSEYTLFSMLDEEIKKYVAEHNDGMKVSNLYIAQIKQKHGIIERENYNKPKSEKGGRSECPKEKEIAIEEALKYFQMIPSES